MSPEEQKTLCGYAKLTVVTNLMKSKKHWGYKRNIKRNAQHAKRRLAEMIITLPATWKAASQHAIARLNAAASRGGKSTGSGNVAYMAQLKPPQI